MYYAPSKVLNSHNCYYRVHRICLFWKWQIQRYQSIWLCFQNRITSTWQSNFIVFVQASFFKKIFYLFIYVCVHVHMSTCHVYADVLGETEIGDIFLVSGATGICEQPNMGTRNKFRSSRKAGRALNHWSISLSLTLTFLKLPWPGLTYENAFQLYIIYFDIEKSLWNVFITKTICRSGEKKSGLRTLWKEG